MISFIKQKRIVNRFIVIAGLLSAILVEEVLFKIISGEFIGLSVAYQNIRFGQEIGEFNPINEIGSAVGDSGLTVSSYQGEKFRIIAPVESKIGDEQKIKITTSPVETFSGNTLFPNSDVYLEFHSKAFSVLTRSDDAGNWSWSNSGKPLEAGEHAIEAYNISPYELAGKRDIFIQKFSFNVDPQIKPVGDLVKLEANEEYKEFIGDGDLGDKFIKDEVKRLYFFDIVIQNKKEYSPGEEIGTQLVFSELGSGERQKSSVKYELFSQDEDTELHSPVATFTEELDTENFDSFFKKITLKNKLQAGNYLMVVTVTGGEDEYVQSTEFTVKDEAVIMVGNNVVTKTKFLSVLIWNSLFILLFIIFLLLLTIYEYKRMMVLRPVDEDYLKSKGYF